MAEYYALLSRAVEGLQRNDEVARREIYVKARSALIKQLKAISPPLPAAEISKQRLALEEAIRRVEREAVEAASAQMLSEEEIGRQAEAALAAALTSEDDVVAESATRQNDGYAEPMAAAPRSEPQEDVAEVMTPPVQPRPFRPANDPPPWDRTANVTDVNDGEVDVEPEMEPPPPRAARGQDWERDSRRRPQRRSWSFGARMTILILFVLVIAAGAYFAITQKETLSDFLDSMFGGDTTEDGTPADDPQAEEPTPEEPVLNITPADDPAPAEPEPAAPDENARLVTPADISEPAVAEPAIGLLQFEPEGGAPAPDPLNANVTWTLLQEEGSDAEILANIVVPGSGLGLTMLIVPVADDPTVSHEASLRAWLSEGEEGSRPRTVQQLTLRVGDDGAQRELIGDAAEVGDFLFIQLPAEAVADNLQLLMDADWFDALIAFESGESATMSFSKGGQGEAVFAQAAEAWSD